jgi:hypothetical protein
MNDAIPTENTTSAGTVQPAPFNRYLVHDGTDAGAAFRAGLEITGICVVSIAIILALYYAGLKALVALFPPKAGSEDEVEED